MDDLDQKKAIVRQFVDMLNDRNLEALDEIVAPGFVRHCQATPDVEVNSLEDFRSFVRQDASTFPDNNVTVAKLVAEGDLVAIYARYTGTQLGPMGPFASSGRRASVEFAGVFRIETGKIAELWVTWDNVALLTQLGHLSFS